MTTLSEAGALRRQQLRSALVAAVVVRRRRRRAARAGTVVALLGALLWWVSARGDAPARTPDGAVPPRELCAIAIDRDDPRIVERLRIVGDGGVQRIVGDAELAAALAGFSRTAGVGRIDGRLLIPGLVVDSFE